MDTRQPYNNRRHEPSLFFPILIITVGVVWLLVNAGRIPVENIVRLLPYWPVLLIALGIGIILQRVSWFLSGIVWLAVAALAVWLMIYPSPSLPAVQTPEMKHKVLQAPLNDVSSAELKLNLSVNPTDIYTLQDSNNLLTADIYYAGNFSFNDNGSGTKRTVQLGENFSGFPWSFPNGFLSAQTQKWQIGISPKPVTNLEINGSTGNAHLDLKGIQLNQLTVHASTGNMTINLPEDSPAFQFNVEASTGNIDINAPSGSAFSLTVQGSTGNMNISVPEDAGVQVEVRNPGIGNVSIPDNFSRTSQGKDQDEGIWQNSNFTSSKTPITIILNMSVGNITIR